MFCGFHGTFHLLEDLNHLFGCWTLLSIFQSSFPFFHDNEGTVTQSQFSKVAFCSFNHGPGISQESSCEGIYVWGRQAHGDAHQIDILELGLTFCVCKTWKCAILDISVLIKTSRYSFFHSCFIWSKIISPFVSMYWNWNKKRVKNLTSEWYQK